MERQCCKERKWPYPKGYGVRAGGEAGEGQGEGDVTVEIDLRAKNEAAPKPAPRPSAGHKLPVYLLSRGHIFYSN